MWSRHAVVYLPNPAVGARGLYAFIVSALGGVPSFHRPALVAQAAERAKRVVVVVDEGHLLSADQLEQLRILTNFEMDSASPLALLLLGQPTLRRRMKLGAFAALDQWIALRYHIEDMDLVETAGYVRHHLALAGRSDPLFSDDALAAIHRTSRGVPRSINNLTLQALVAAFAEGKGIVNESCARTAIEEVTSE